MKKDIEKTAYLISIGDELLIGQVTDTNSAWIAQNITGLGINVKKILTVQDEEKEIINALNEAAEKADLVITTGGLGPTVDDITKKTFAKFFGVEMKFNEAFFEKTKAYVAKRGHSIDDILFNYSFFPANTTFLKNSVGSAPGMLFKKGKSTIISLPGVPPEMKSIFNEEIAPILEKDQKGFYIVKKTILTAGEIEAALADRLKNIVNSLPSNMSFAYLPNLGRVRLRITAKGSDKKSLEDQVNHIIDLIKVEIGQLIFGYDEDTLEEKIGRMLIDKKMTMGTAESCTGGLIAHKITSNSGSSSYFKGSIIAYSNEVKENILNVNSSTLEKYGAVSKQTVIEMVLGTLDTINCDIAIAVSGIAGPTGGTEKKPVGTIWIACGTKEKIKTKKLQLGTNRLKNIETSTVLALDLLRKMLI